MFDYMYQYRGEIKRLITNNRYNKRQAINHTQSLYNRGLIDLTEWNTLRDYCDTFGKVVK